jgi:hypothetical protein
MVSTSSMVPPAGAFVIGVPLQFSADGLLSKAVWWHNARYAGDAPR